RTEDAVRPFFTEEMGKRRCRTLRVVCMDVWAPYAKLVRDHAVNAQILFDRFHIVKHLSDAVDAARRELWRQLSSKEKVEVKGTRWLLLKNPWNLTNDQKERLSTLVRWNSPLVRAWYLKESFQLFWGYKQPWRAKQHLLKWINSAIHHAEEWLPGEFEPPPPLVARGYLRVWRIHRYAPGGLVGLKIERGTGVWSSSGRLLKYFGHGADLAWSGDASLLWSLECRFGKCPGGAGVLHVLKSRDPQSFEKRQETDIY